MITQYFTKSGDDPMAQVKWVRRDCRISDPDGDITFEMMDVEAPEFWSQLAVDIAASKYFRKSGVPETGHEDSVRQLIERVVSTILKSGEQQGYFENREQSQLFARELTYILVNQLAAFNSPVWFNCGIYHQYGIKGSARLYYWSPEKNKIVEIRDAYAHPQVSACFIQGVEDTLESIFELAKNEAMLFKYGSGTGTNFSNLRGKSESLSGGGKSSGLMAFLEVLDKGAGATKSGGITRRAAKMVCLDADHPEIMEFIKWKCTEEHKAKALVKTGYSSGMEGEAYRTVSGQNSNNSVRVTDRFMQAVADDKEWNTLARTSGETVHTYKARQLWEEIAKAAWECADPGLQFEDIIQYWHTCPNSGPIRASNPCSEYMFLNDSACNLASLNVVKFLKPDGSFDVDGYLHTTRIMTVAQDILVDLAGYPTAKIANNSHRFRPLGLGYTNVGSFLMRQGIPYDSELGREWISVLTALLHGQAYLTSALISAQKGPFAGFQENREAMLAVIDKHKQALVELKRSLNAPVIYDSLRKLWNEVTATGTQYGFRNSQVTAIAPTGTISLLMDCDTTGIEPDYSLIKIKMLSGGGRVQIVNQAVQPALRCLSYSEHQIAEIMKHLEQTYCLEGAPHLKQEHLAVFDCANRCGCGTRYIRPLAHVEAVARAQKFVSGAISKTVNLPEEATAQQIQDIYWQSWKLGLKSISVYRDSSKQSQPLTGDKLPTEVFECQVCD